MVGLSPGIEEKFQWKKALSYSSGFYNATNEDVNAGINLTHERRYNFDPPVRLVSNRFRFLVFL